MNPTKKQLEPRTPRGERYDFYSLCLASNEELETTMRMGVTPDPKDLAGWEFKGWNTTELAYLIANKKFKKGFLKKPGEDSVKGYNVVVLQNHLGEPWIDKLRGADAIRGRYFDVSEVSLNSIDNKYPNALIFNYWTAKNNFPLDPARLLKDYFVQVYPDNPDLLVGKAFGSLGPLRLYQSYMVVERNNRALL